MMGNLEKVADGLAEMEPPLLEVRSLAMAVRMMAAASELPANSREALDAVADIMFDRLIGLCEDRSRLWKLAHKAAA
jgi:hypothetical protein